MFRGNNSGGYGFGNGLPPSPPAGRGRVPSFSPFPGFAYPPRAPEGPQIGNVTINFRRGGGHSVLLDCNPCPETVSNLHRQSSQSNNQEERRRPVSPAGSEAGSHYSSSSMSSLGSSQFEFLGLNRGGNNPGVSFQNGILQQSPPVGFLPSYPPTTPASYIQELQQQGHSMGTQTEGDNNTDDSAAGNTPDTTGIWPALPSPTHGPQQ